MFALLGKQVTEDWRHDCKSYDSRLCDKGQLIVIDPYPLDVIGQKTTFTMEI